MTRVLIVDDEPQILRTLRLNLKARRYEVSVAADGGEALREVSHWHPDIVVLDLGLPDIDGIDVIHGLRGWTQVPIIVLSGRTGSDDKVDALDAGADDYITKPFGVDELLARIRAVSRRTGSPNRVVLRAQNQYGEPTIAIGDYVVDLENKTVRAKDQGDPLHLTPIQWRLVEILLRNPGKLISQRQLLTEIWGSGAVRKTHYLRQYMAQLRRKFEADPGRPRHLLTELGMGYRFQP